MHHRKYIYDPLIKAITCPALSDIPYGSIFQDSSDGIRDNYLSEAEYTCRRGMSTFCSSLVGIEYKVWLCCGLKSLKINLKLESYVQGQMNILTKGSITFTLGTRSSEFI